MSTTDYQDYSRQVETRNFIDQHPGNMAVYNTGHVYTFHGIVEVYAHSGTHTTQLTMVRNGRVLTRCLDAYYRPRTIVTLAQQFAFDMAKESTPYDHT